PPLVVRAIIPPPEKVSLDITGDFAGPAVFSPDGTQIAFVARSEGIRSIWVRPLDALAPRRLDDTEGASFPFWSADSRQIAYFAEGKLRRIPAAGGPTATLADASNPRGGAWGRDNVIVFSPDYQGGLSMVPAVGGVATVVTHVDPQKHSTHRWPAFLPDGRHFLYLATQHTGGDPQVNGLYLASIEGGEPRLVVPCDSNGFYASGRLLYHAHAALMTQPFDPVAGKVTGDPAPLIDGVQFDAGTWRMVASASETGNLVYVRGSAILGAELAWLGRDGKEAGARMARDSYRDPAVSPDGKKLAVAIGDPLRTIWIIDLAQGTRSRLTFDTQIHISPTWSPDGRTIAYTSGTSPNGTIHRKSADGSSADEVVAEEKGANFSAPTFTPDGKSVVCIRATGPSGNAIVVVPLEGDRTPKVVVPAPNPQANLNYPRVSPDGRWLAYSSTETGRLQLYVTSFPSGSGKWLVSDQTSDIPAWRRDGKELYYVRASEIMAAEVTAVGGQFSVGPPRLMATIGNSVASGRVFDVMPDGSRFIVPVVSSDSAAPIQLLMNWPGALKLGG
ncbi:MAG TPA: hypothetical protein VJV75_02350, partial [Candidatus Polarisedimenticolia bacterium]|nr:hypothetical protein [Candidatus Polarisedimenticolia bacterium]